MQKKSPEVFCKKRCSVKKGVLKNFANTGVFLTPTQMFSSQICEIFYNTYFEEHLWTTASINSMINLVWLYKNWESRCEKKVLVCKASLVNTYLTYQKYLPKDIFKTYLPIYIYLSCFNILTSSGFELLFQEFIV